MMQRDLDDTSHRLSVHAPTVATSGLLKLNLSLGFLLDHWDDLGMGVHQFGMGQHTSVTKAVLKACTDQHQVTAGGGAAPSLEEASTMIAPDRLFFRAPCPCHGRPTHGLGRS